MCESVIAEQPTFEWCAEAHNSDVYFLVLLRKQKELFSTTRKQLFFVRLVCKISSSSVRIHVASTRRSPKSLSIISNGPTPCQRKTVYGAYCNITTSSLSTICATFAHNTEWYTKHTKPLYVASEHWGPAKYWKVRSHVERF